MLRLIYFFTPFLNWYKHYERKLLSASCLPHESYFVFVPASQAKRTLKAQKLQDELASGKLDQAVSVQ